MFDAIVFTKALVVGLSVAAPVGPIGLLTIQRTIDRGFRMGLATGLGAAVADATFGTVGALGVTWLIAALTTARVPLALGGAALLLGLAWRTSRPSSPRRGPASTMRGDAGSTSGQHLS